VVDGIQWKLRKIIEEKRGLNYRGKEGLKL
jgi:hypothetical protein